MSIELTKEKSQELADSLSSIKLLLWGIDIEYAKEVSKRLRQQASMQDTLAVLNPRYNPSKSDMLGLQSKMLEHIIKYMETGKEVDALKQSIDSQEQAFDKIANLFI